LEINATTGRLEMIYPVIIERGEHDFSAGAPDLPGCVSTGSTAEKAHRNIREAIELHVTGMREGGLHVPAPSAVAFAEVG